MATVWATFGENLATFYSFIWSHCLLGTIRFATIVHFAVFVLKKTVCFYHHDDDDGDKVHLTLHYIKGCATVQ